MLFDSHAHLDDGRFEKDRENTLNHAKESGVGYIMNPGANLKTSVRAVDLAAKYEMIYASVGVHPHDAKELDEITLELLRGFTKKPKVMAIGEIGLDFYYDHSPRSIQREGFRRQIKLAREVQLPIIVHDRDANEEVFRILKEERAFDVGVVMHCYSGSAELAKQYVRQEAYISIAGPVTYQNAKKTVEVVKTVPLEYLFVETDSPYLTPAPYRGKRNEPAHVKLVVEKIAELKRIDFEEAAIKTTENAKKFFKIK